jgi:GDPmannose 4,6-dehydratase
LLEKLQPDEIYNLAAASSVAMSFEKPYATAQVNGFGALNLLEAIRRVNPHIRFFQAGSSEMFGQALSVPQTEETPFQPRNPYGVAKLNTHWLTVSYRESFDIFASSGILFNHESPLRGMEFVTRKISDHVARIRLGKLDVLELGNLDAMRDWGFAGEYVDAMWRMLQAQEPDTFVLATNRTQSVRDFVRMAFRGVGVVVAFEGSAENETARVAGFDPIDATGQDPLKIGQTVMRVNPYFYRPVDTNLTLGDPAKAKSRLDWAPQTTLAEICQMMVQADMTRLTKE